MEVSRRLHRITCRIGTSKPLYQHLIVGDDSWLWIDAGIVDTPDDFMIPYLADHSLTAPALQCALVTHADVDHFGGLSRLRAHFPSLVAVAHRLDAPLIVDHGLLFSDRYVLHRDHGVVPPAGRQQELCERAGEPSTIDVLVDGGETIDLGAAGQWKILHLDGHSPGHIGVWEPQRREVILGDAVLGWGIENVDRDLVAPPPYFDVARYSRTIDVLERLEAGTMFTSHYPIMRDAEIGAFLAECRDAVDAIGKATLTTRRDAASLEELCQMVGAALNRWPRESWLGLADPISAHLKQMAGVVS